MQPFGDASYLIEALTTVAEPNRQVTAR